MAGGASAHTSRGGMRGPTEALPRADKRHARLLWGVAIGIALAAAVMLIIQCPTATLFGVDVDRQ